MASTVIYQKRGNDKVKVAETPDLSPYAIKDDVDAELATKADAEDLGITDKRVDNLAALLNGALSTQNTDATAAYAKTVPSKAQPYAAIDAVGGKTVVWNQLVSGMTTDTKDGVTTSYDETTHLFTIKNDSRTTNYGTGSSRNPIITVALDTTHKYIVIGSSSNDLTGVSIQQFTGGTQRNPVLLDTIFQPEENTYTSLRILNTYDFVTTHPVGDVTTFYLNVIDLTLMFGSGNEPSTVSEFQQLFPSIDPAYNAGELISAGVTSIVSEDAEDATLATLPIPAAVQQLPGYGWSAGTAYNYIDWQRKVYVQRVGGVDLGTLTWTPNATYTNTFNGITLPQTASWNLLNALCAKYQTFPSADVGTQNKGIALGGNRVTVYVRDIDFTDAATFKTAMSGVMLYYELATPVETDISQYLTDDNLLQVEPGGSVTFPNVLSDDYRLPVPSGVEYTIDLAPDAPSTDGTYTLQCVVSDGVPTYSWVSA